MAASVTDEHSTGHDSLETPFSIGSSHLPAASLDEEGWQTAHLASAGGAAARHAADALESIQQAKPSLTEFQQTASLNSARDIIDGMLDDLSKQDGRQESNEAHTLQIMQRAARGIVSCTDVDDYKNFLQHVLFAVGTVAADECGTLALNVNTLERADDANVELPESALIVQTVTPQAVHEGDDTVILLCALGGAPLATAQVYTSDDATASTLSGAAPVDKLLEDFDTSVRTIKQTRFPIAINGSGVRGSGVLDQRQNALRLLAGTLVVEEPTLKPVPALAIAAQIIALACSPQLRARIEQAAVQLVSAPTLVTIDFDNSVAETVVFHVGSGKHSRGWGTYIRYSRLSTFSIAPISDPDASIAKIECEFAQDVVIEPASHSSVAKCAETQPWVLDQHFKSLFWVAPTLLIDISWVMDTTCEEASAVEQIGPVRSSLADPGAQEPDSIIGGESDSSAQQDITEQQLDTPLHEEEDLASSVNLQDLLRAIERRQAGEHSSLPMHTPVYSWGKGEFGALGHGLFSDAKLPVPALFGLDLGLVRVKSISCSWFHSAAVSDLGLVYTWGSGNDGALGHGNNTSLTTPQLVEYFGMENPLAAVAVACGSDMAGAHTIVLTSGREASESSDEARVAGVRVPISNRVYAFGAGAGCGLGRSSSSMLPQRVRAKDFDEASANGLSRIAAGGSCSAVVSTDGEVYTWGRWANGRLGLGSVPILKAKKEGAKDKVQQLQLSPRKVDFHSRKPIKVVDIAIGEQHMLCVDLNGHIWTWGRGDAGQLGTGFTQDIMLPRRILVKEETTADELSEAGTFNDTASVAVSSIMDDLETAASMYSDVLPNASTRSSQVSGGTVRTKEVLFVAVAAGMSHSLAISADGGLFTWGGRGGAMLGHGDRQQRIAAEEDQANEEATLFELVETGASTHQFQPKRPYLLPRRVRALCGSIMGAAGEVVAVDGGAAHSIAVTAAGELFVWGDNEDSALGSTETEVPIPQLVNTGSNIRARVQYDKEGITLKRSPDLNRSDEYFYGSHMRTELAFLISCSGWHSHVVTLGSSLGIDMQAATPAEVRGQLKGFQQNTASTLGAQSPSEPLFMHDGASTVSKTATYATHSNGIGAFDTLLRVENGSVFAHKCVLAARSPRLQAMIKEEEVADRITELSLPDVPLRILLVVLEFMYTDNLCIPLSPASPDLLVILLTAEAYGLSKLAALCKAMASSPVAPLVYNEGPAEEESGGEDAAKADLFNFLEAPHLLESTTHAMISGEWADTVFLASGQRLAAHRTILCSRSEYFAALFRDPSRTLQTAVDASEEVNDIAATDIVEIEVPDDAWEFRRLLCFLYTSALPECTPELLKHIGHDYASEVFLNDLILADKYAVIRMKNSAESLVDINRFNAAKAFLVADMVSAPRLRERAALFLVSNIGQVLDTTAWNNLQVSRPDLISELQARIRDRNRVYLGPAATIKTKTELHIEEEAKKSDGFLEHMSISWATILALVVFGILYIYVSAYNTSFGNIVPALNVAVLLGAIGLGMKNLAE